MPAPRVDGRLGVGLLVLAALAAGVVGWLGDWHLGDDSAVYRAGALAFLHGDSFYSPERLSALPPWVSLPFIYPPAAALLFVPLAALPSGLAWGVVSAASLVSLAVVVRLCARRGTLPVAGMTVCALALEPVWKTLFLGQINLILMALVIVDVLALASTRWAGVLTGVAAAVKLTPLIFVAHLFVTGRWRAGLRALGTFAGLQVVMLALAPRDAVHFWLGGALHPDQTDGVYWIFNQSLDGLVHRATHDARWSLVVALVLGAVIAAPSVWLVRRLHSRGETLGALLVTAFVGLLVSPISWSHHWVWAVPLAVLLVVRGRWLWAAAVVALFVSCVVMLVPNGGVTEFGWGLGWSIPGNAYVLAAAFGILGLAVRERWLSRGREVQVSPGAPDFSNSA